MAKYTAANIVVNFDNASGDPIDMTQYITEINGVGIEVGIEEASTFGSSWSKSLAAGLRKSGDITIGGFYDDTVSVGQHAIFNAVPVGSATTRTLAITWGSTKITSMEVFIKSYTRTPSRGGISKFQVVLLPTGTISEA